MLRFNFLACVVMSGLLTASYSYGQTRLSDPNSLTWLAGFGNIGLTQKTSLYVESQARREGPVQNWQLWFFRGGIQQKLGKRFTGILGYGYFQGYPYGEYSTGHYPVGEHRIWQQLSWDDAAFRGFSFNHRLRSEQRFIQRVPQSAPERRVDGYAFVNRLRYQLRATLPLSFYPATATTEPASPALPAPVRPTRTYLAAYDEIFIGFGKNVGQNIFDQNRTGLLFGYVFDRASRVRVEGGYFNQTVLQGAEVQGKEVVQYNHGLVVNAYYTLPAKPRQ